MNKTAFLFSGQGAQFEGMGKDIEEKSQAAKALYDEASAQIGFDINSLTAKELADTRYAQVATFVLSYCIWNEIKSQVKEDEVVLGGFSLGEYTAFAASEVLAFDKTIELVNKRAAFMSHSAQKFPGAMLAVLGLDDSVIETILEEEYANKLWPVNYNAPGQLVIAGDIECIQSAEEILLEAGAKRVIPLQVSGAFHTPLMTQAADHLADFAKQYKINNPKLPIYCNNTADLSKIKLLSEDFPRYIKEHMLGPVRWTETIENMYAHGVRHFIELGPGSTLKGLVKRILRTKQDVEISSISSWNEISSFLES